MSARSLIGWGVSRRAIVLVSAAVVAGLGGLAREEKTVSCSLHTHVSTNRQSDTEKRAHVSANLKASYGCPYIFPSGQATCSYSFSNRASSLDPSAAASSSPEGTFDATCRMMEATALDFMYRSSHLVMSSGETRRFERSI